MIKTIIFALFIAASGAAPHRNADFHCPEADIADTSCLGPKDCLYPNPDDCNSFIQCTVNADNTTGTPVVMPCAPGDLEWNDNKKECDWASESTCSRGSTAAPTSEPSTAEPSTAEPSTAKPSSAQPSTAEPSTAQPSSAQPSTAEPSTAQPSTAQPSSEAPSSTSGGSGAGSTSGPNFVCPRKDIANTGCKGPKDCLYPNPENCNSFIQCTVNPDGSGTPVVMPCAPGNLEWNDDKKECDYPSSSTCNRGTTAAQTSEPSTAEPSTAQPSSARPSTAEPSTAEPSTVEPSTAQPSTAAPSSTSGGSGAGSTSGPNFVCPREDIANTGCKGPKDCLYPNPENCNSFIQCTVNPDGSGTPVVMPCAPGNLEWNDDKKECDYPSSSTCNRGSTAAPTSEPSTAEPSTAEPSTGRPSTSEPSTAQPSSAQPSTAEPSTAEPSTAEPSTAEPSTAAPTSSSTGGGSGSGSTSGPDFTCPRDDIANTGCKGPKDCLYPNPENCNSFIQCTVNNDGSGTPVVMPCPDGLEWNDNEKVCDWSSSSTCNRGSTARPSTGAPSTASPSTAAPSSTARPSTPASTSASTPAESTTDGGSGGDSTPTPTDSTTGAASEQTTTEQTQSSTLPACRPDDDDNDSDLNLAEICGTGCTQTRAVAHPSNNRKYIICSSSNSVQKCAEGLLYSKDKVSCTYAGLVDPNGPSSRS